MRKTRFLTICILFFTFLSGEVLSAVDAQFLVSLEVINSQKSLDDIQCSESQESNFGNEADVLACVVDICGPVEKLSPASPTTQNIDEYLEKIQLNDHFEEVRPEVEKASAIILAQWEKRKKELNEYTSAAKVNQFINNLPDEKLSKMMSKVFDIFQRPKMVLQDGKITPVDSFRYDDVPPSLIKGMKSIRAQMLFKRSQGPLGFKLITDPKQKKQTIEEISKRYSLYFQELKEKFPAAISNLSDPLSPDFQKKTEAYQELDLMLIEEQYLSRFPRTFCQEECQKVLKDVFLDNTKGLSALYGEMGKELANKKSDFMLQCQTYAALSNKANSGFQELEKKLPSFYQQVLEKFSPYLSEHSRSLLGAKLNSIKVSNSTSSLLNPLANLKDVSNNVESSLKNSPLEEYLFNDYSYLKKQNKANLSPFKITNACEDSQAHTVWDYAMPWTDDLGMNLSHFTCLNHDHNNYAEKIIYHEIGHLFDHILKTNGLSSSSKKISEEQKVCISSQQKNLPQNAEGQNGKITEDYADFFAAIISSESSDHNGKGLCNSLTTDGMQKNFQNINLKISDRRHSNTVYRLLHSIHIRGEAFPESCQQLFNKNKNTFEFKDCR